MTYAGAVRLYSFAELVLFTALLVVWIGRVDEGAEMILGWSHGIGWIGLCVAVAVACRRGDYPWPVLAATVSPLGPLGSTIGIEWARARARVA